MKADGDTRRASSGRRVYRQSQGESTFPSASVQQISSIVVPAGSFVVVTFGMENIAVDKLHFFLLELDFEALCP